MAETALKKDKGSPRQGWRKFRLLAVSFIILFFLLPFGAFAPKKTHAFRTFFPNVHGDITRQTLFFLDANVLDRVVAGNYDQDANSTFRDEARRHFDSCYFRESAALINAKFNEIRNFNPHVNPDPAAYAFGERLHIIQDFYAHSNWIETRGDELFVEHVDPYWPSLAGGEGYLYKDLIILQTPRAADIDLINPISNFAVLVQKTDGTRHFGLTSGEYGTSQCLVHFPHGDILDCFSYGLNQDWSCRPNFNLAYDSAKRQTLKEWCRLAQAVLVDHGSEGARSFRDHWFSGWSFYWPDSELDQLPRNCRTGGGEESHDILIKKSRTRSGIGGPGFGTGR